MENALVICMVQDDDSQRFVECNPLPETRLITTYVNQSDSKMRYVSVNVSGSSSLPYVVESAGGMGLYNDDTFYEYYHNKKGK